MSNHENYLASYLQKSGQVAVSDPHHDMASENHVGEVGNQRSPIGDSESAQFGVSESVVVSAGVSGSGSDIAGEQFEKVAEEVRAAADSLDSILPRGDTVGFGFPGFADPAQPRLGPQSYLEDFQTYVVPIPSTDYRGLEKLDVRLTDRIWRLENLYSVVNEDGVLVKFKLRDAQRWLLQNMHWKNIILKARQLGFTTFICIFLLDYALFNRNKNIGIIAHTQKDATVIFRKVKIAWDNLNAGIKDFLELRAVGDSKSEYEFTNGSLMIISTSLRSGTYQAVLITEFGKLCAQYPEKAEEIVTGTLPAANKGLVFIESTAEGEDGHFYDMCIEAMTMEASRRPYTFKDFKFFFFPWYQNPANQVDGDIQIDGETEKYLNETEDKLKLKFSTPYRNWYFLEKKMQKQKMKQEHPSTPEEAFISTGNKLFPGEMVDIMIRRWVKDPIEIIGEFNIYVNYIKGHLYGLGADVSQGVSRDSSTIIVIDYTTGEVVMTYKNDKIDPVSFAYEIKKAALMYGGCIAAPEANNVGMTTCVTLHNIYPNIYTQVREDLLEEQITQKLGWLTTGGTKPMMMNEMAQSMQDSELKIPDRGILLEAKKFKKEDALTVQVTAGTTRHFDKLTGCAIAWQMRKFATKGLLDPAQQAQIEQRRAERSSPNRMNTYR